MYGIELCAGLRHFIETTRYVTSFEAVNNEIDAAYATRRGLHKPMLPKRAAFPNDRAKQGVIFPIVDDGENAEGDEEEAGGTGG